jgi:hypothetical protein
MFSGVMIFGLISWWAFVNGVINSRYKGRVFQLTPYLLPWGIFVWGDAVVFGLFWGVMSILILVLNDWYLAGVVYSLFWLVRAVIESVYWIGQQFSPIKRNPPESLKGFTWFGDDSIWFIYQTIWQCVAVVAAVAGIFFVRLWIRN